MIEIPTTPWQLNDSKIELKLNCWVEMLIVRTTGNMDILFISDCFSLPLALLAGRSQTISWVLAVTPRLADSPLGDGGRSATALFHLFRDRGSSVAATCRPSSSSPATPYAALKASTSSSPTRAHSLTLSLSRFTLPLPPDAMGDA